MGLFFSHCGYGRHARQKPITIADKSAPVQGRFFVCWEERMFNKKTLKDVNVQGKKVFVRVDFNVPIKDGKVQDDTRILAALPTIEYLLQRNAAVILASHLGRPGGEINIEFSLKPVSERLKELIKAPVKFAPDCLGEIAQEAVKNLKQGEVLLLENTRFYSGEEKNDLEMGRELASLAEIFINDAFGTAHRAHASNVGVAEFLPAAAGLLLEKEIIYLGNAIANPERPFTAILGGAKVSGKIDVINNLINKVDHILIGGGMANTFFAAKGLDMAESLVETEALQLALDILEKAGDKLRLPVDFVIADDFSNEAKYKSMLVDDIPAGWRVMDLGESSLEDFSEVISTSKTIVWNGPMGVFEFGHFAKGTFELAKMVADADAVSIIGGGDSAAAVVQAGLAESMTHISTGGGASLKMLEGASLPGLDALDDK
jgi:phosphoglycerate kinase